MHLNASRRQQHEQILSGYLRSLSYCLAFLFIWMGLVIASVGLDRAFPGDELRFIETSRQFGENFSLSLLKHYEEMSTPLPFMLYGLWGNVAGWDLPTMRVGALLVALITYIALHHYLYGVFRGGWQTIFLFVWIAVQPYMAAMSMFVYTDMPAIGFALLGLIAVHRRQPALTAVATAGMLLCRQYLVIFPLAAGIFFLCAYLYQRQRRDLFMLIALVAGSMPMLALFALWGGLNPDNQVQHLYVHDAFAFHAEALVLYIATFAVYASPVIVTAWRTIYGDARVLAACAALSLLYWLFPVRPSPSAIAVDVHTVGLFDRLVWALLGGGLARDLVFFLAFALALPVMVWFALATWRRWRETRFDHPLFLLLMMWSFLLVMPLSYLHWEKYFLPMLPVVGALILLLRHEQASEVERSSQPTAPA